MSTGYAAKQRSQNSRARSSLLPPEVGEDIAAELGPEMTPSACEEVGEHSDKKREGDWFLVVARDSRSSAIIAETDGRLEEREASFYMSNQRINSNLMTTTHLSEVLYHIPPLREHFGAQWPLFV